MPMSIQLESPRVGQQHTHCRRGEMRDLGIDSTLKPELHSSPEHTNMYGAQRDKAGLGKWAQDSPHRLRRERAAVFTHTRLWAHACMHTQHADTTQLPLQRCPRGRLQLEEFPCDPPRPRGPAPLPPTSSVHSSS